MKNELYADIILPLAVKGFYTYRIPDFLYGKVFPGSRVIVSFGKKKLYTGIVRRIHDKKPFYQGIKNISDVIDTSPLIDETQLRFWEWIADYYMCCTGEVMKAALPSGFCPESETLLHINPAFTDFSSFDEQSLHLVNIIEKKKSVRLKNLTSITGDRSIMRLVNNLINNNVLIAGEAVKIKSVQPAEKYIVLSRKFSLSELESVLESLKKAPRQYALLSAYLKITSYTSGIDIIPVRKSILLKESGSLSSSAATLEKKGIFISLELEAGTEEKTNNEAVIPEPLSETQAQVYNKIKEQLKRKNILLLHGVTYGGKKQIYIHLIKEYLTMGKQVLYLLPEIASTSQIIRRLRRYFGPVTDICHSRLSETQKLKLWKKIAEKDPEKRTGLTVGTRSSIFLPFSDLGLIIVDDEHEVLYKQQDPAPRYHARDSAIMLGSFTGAVTVLGSATPSVESYYNAMTGKYGFTEIRERYGRINLPEIILVNTREAYRKKMMVSHFSPQLLEAIEQALQKREQVLIFRNRRGFSPYLQCGECGWILTCSKCAVNLTYHREMNRMICHYCSSVYSVPSECPSCGSLSVETRGYGTEKIEDEIKLLFPGTKVARMDKDTTHRADSVNSILKDFEDNRIDILVGTQMISRSLSTENLTVTGILNIDSIMNIPDFRAHERAFQFIAQVTGKTGRKNKQGKVIIQSYDPNHRIMKYLLRNDYRGFYEAQLEERKTFNYPPFCRLVKITMKHKDKRLLNEFADRLCEKLREHFEDRVLGPEFPVISRIQLWYLKEILIKIERDKSFHQARGIIRESIDEVTSMKGTTMLKVLVDVDPY